MRTPLHVVCLTLCAQFLIRLGHAESALPTPIEFSVKAAFDSALALSPEIKTQTQQLASLNAKIQESKRLTPRPVSLDASYRSDNYYNNNGLREIELGFSTPLWNWNERTATQALLEAQANEYKATQLVQKLQLAGEIRRAYWSTLAAYLDVEIAQNRTLNTKQLMLDVEKRVDAGELAQTDFLHAKSLYASTRIEMGRALSALSLISAEFSSLTGLPATVLEHTQNEPAPNPEMITRAQHPELLLAQSQLETEKQKQALLYSQKRENVEVGLALVKERSAWGTLNEKSLLLSTRFVLGEHPDYQSRTLSAQASHQLAQAQLEQRERALIAQTQAAMGSVEVFAQLQKTALQQAALAKQLYELFQESFKLGETALPDLLRYEQQAFEAERLSQKTKIEWSAKLSNLRQALGLLPE